MNRAIKVFGIYLLFLIICSLIFNWLNISSDSYNVGASIYRVRPIMLPTVIGGIIALKYTVPQKQLKIFLIVYFFLWLFRYLILFAADNLGEVHFFNKTFRFDLIISNYYKTASRLETPLPFIIFWFIYYFYTSFEKSVMKKKQD